MAAGQVTGDIVMIASSTRHKLGPTLLKETGRPPPMGERSWAEMACQAFGHRHRGRARP